MLPVIHIGPLSIQARGLILLLAFWFAAEATERGAKRLGLRSDHVYNFAFWAGLAGLLGARLGYVLEYWSVYQNNLGAVFELNLNTFSPLAGVFVASVVAYACAQRKGMANRRWLDALTPGFSVFACGLALADWASGEGYGAPALLPWSIELWGELRHPTQVYQLLAVIAIGLVVLRSSRPFEGARFGIFVTFYAASRLLIEAFHGDSVTFAGVRVVQVWSLLAILAALILLRRWASSSSGDRLAPSPDLDHFVGQGS